MKKRHGIGLSVLVVVFVVYVFIASTTRWIADFKLPDQLTFRKQPNQFLNANVQVSTKSAPIIRFEPKPLNTTAIFANDHSWVATASASKTTTIVMTGDLIPVRTTNAKVAPTNNFDIPFKDTADILRRADLSVVNLETPLTKNCPLTNQGMSFCGDSRWATGMKNAGIDVATLENNHITNKGTDGVNQTINYLQEAGIEFANRNKLLIKKVKDKKIGILAFNGIGEKIDRPKIADKINESKQLVDILIVAYHWGKEYTYDPAPDSTVAPDNPVEIAHLAIDSGADLVQGNHPHWVQGIEIYKDRLISYALGNYIFDQDWSIETQEGAVAKYTFYENTLIDMEITPIKIEGQTTATVATGDARFKILNKMRESSERLMKY